MCLQLHWYQDSLHQWILRPSSHIHKGIPPEEVSFLEEGFTLGFHLGVQATVPGTNTAVQNPADTGERNGAIILSIVGVYF